MRGVCCGASATRRSSAWRGGPRSGVRARTGACAAAKYLDLDVTFTHIYIIYTHARSTVLGRPRDAAPSRAAGRAARRGARLAPTATSRDSDGLRGRKEDRLV